MRLRSFHALALIFLNSGLGCQSDSIELLLQDPLQYERPGDRCAAEHCARLLTLINSAERTIDFAVYGARNQTQILEAILDAQQRGIQVRGLVDRDAAGHNYYTSTDEWVRRIGSVSSDRCSLPFLETAIIAATTSGAFVWTLEYRIPPGGSPLSYLLNLPMVKVHLPQVSAR